MQGANGGGTKDFWRTRVECWKYSYMNLKSYAKLVGAPIPKLCTKEEIYRCLHDEDLMTGPLPEFLEGKFKRKDKVAPVYEEEEVVISGKPSWPPKNDFAQPPVNKEHRRSSTRDLLKKWQGTIAKSQEEGRKSLQAVNFLDSKRDSMRDWEEIRRQSREKEALEAARIAQIEALEEERRRQKQEEIEKLKQEELLKEEEERKRIEEETKRRQEESRNFFQQKQREQDEERRRLEEEERERQEERLRQEREAQERLEQMQKSLVDQAERERDAKLREQRELEERKTQEQERIRREMTEQERLKQAAIDLKARQEEETRLQKVAEEERKRQNWIDLADKLAVVPNTLDIGDELLEDYANLQEEQSRVGDCLESYMDLLESFCKKLELEIQPTVDEYNQLVENVRTAEDEYHKRKSHIEEIQEANIEFEASQEELKNVLLDKATVSELKAMRRPVPLIRQVVALAILISRTEKVKEDLTQWNTCRRCLFRDGLYTIKHRNMVKDHIMEAASLLKKNSVTEENCARASKLALSLFHLISSAVKLFIESEQEGTHNLKKMLDHFRDFEKEVQKQLAGFRVRISKKQSKIDEWTAFNNAMQQHYMRVNSCYLSQDLSLSDELGGGEME